MDTNEIIIDKDYYCWNGSRMIYFQCEHVSRVEGRCGGDSSFTITFYTEYTSIKTKHYCARHVNDFIKIAQDKGYKITDMRGVK